MSLSGRSIRPVLHVKEPNWIPVYVLDSTADRNFGEEQDRSVKSQTRLQGRKRSLGTALLEIGERSIEDQQGRNHCRFVVLMQHDLKDNRNFKQPWDRRPELGHCIAKWMSRSIRHCIGAILFKTDARLIAREAFRGHVLSRLYDLIG